MNSQVRIPGTVSWFLGVCLLFSLPTSASAQKAAPSIPSLKANSSESAGRPTWFPPDVDERVPAAEAGATCSLDEVVEKAAKRVLELVQDGDRFTATELLTHESINKDGRASSPEKRKFAYVVSIQERRQGHLVLTEYRNGGGALNEFPGGIVTSGLPALVLIFHPYYAPNYELTCEGLARSNGGFAWGGHFRQMPHRRHQKKPSLL